MTEMSSKPTTSHLQFMTARELVDHLHKENLPPMTMMITAYGPEGDCLARVYPREGSAGYRRCGVSFNPSQDRRVAKIKALAAGLMDAIDEEILVLDSDDGDGKRCMATAMTYLESAQMFAVKGLFMKPPETD